jgi:hypothetical protein
MVRFLLVFVTIFLSLRLAHADEWRAVVMIGHRIAFSAPDESLHFVAGSGTLISRDGVILTNYHVIHIGAEEEAYIRKTAKRSDRYKHEYTVYLPTEVGKHPRWEYWAVPLVVNRALDLAVMRIVRDKHDQPVANLNLPFLRLGSPQGLRPGSRLRIYGYPANRNFRLTQLEGQFLGYRYDHSNRFDGWLHVDARLSGGFSGGAAVDEQQRLVGIPSLIEYYVKEECRGVVAGLREPDEVLQPSHPCFPESRVSLLRPVSLAADVLQQAFQEVVIEGQIVDARSGEGVPGARFAVLKPPVTWGSYRGQADQVLIVVVTGKDGRFALRSAQIAVGQAYSIGWGKDGYKDGLKDNFVVTGPRTRLVLRLHRS